MGRYPLNTKYDQRADESAGQHARDTESAIKSLCIGTDLAAIQKCVEEQVRAQHESQRSEYDLSAQQAMADWALGVLVVSFVTLIATVAGVIYVRNTLLETRKIGNKQLRAYVSVISLEIVHTSGDWMPNIRIKFKNFGQTPAYGLKNVCDYEFHRLGQPGQPRFSVRPAHRQVGKMDLGPGQDMTSTMLIPVSQWEVYKPLLEGKITSLHRADLFVFGEVTYCDAFDEPRWTKYRFRLDIDDNGVVDGEAFRLTHQGNESN